MPQTLKSAANTQPGRPIPSATSSPDLSHAQTATADWAQFQVTLDALTTPLHSNKTVEPAPLPSIIITPVPVPNGISTPFPLPLPKDTPAASADQYRLHSLSRDSYFDALAWMKDLIKNGHFGSDYGPSQSPYDRSHYEEGLTTLQREMLMSFPELGRADQQLPWDLAREAIDAHFDDGIINYSPDDLTKLLEMGLNDGEIPRGRVSEWLSSAGFPVTVHLEAENLFGKDQPGEVDQINFTGSNYENLGVLAIGATNDGKFIVRPVSHSLVFTWKNEENISLADHNHSGQAEVIIEVSGVGSHASWSDIEIYEWQGDLVTGQFALLNPTADRCFISSDWNYCDPNWIFRAREDQPDIEDLVKSVRYSNPCQIKEADAVYETRYEWNGGRYQWMSEGWSPYSGTDSVDCRLDWAEIVGGDNRQAYDFIQNVLQNWAASSTIEESWGPAAEDYFRFKLGVLDEQGGNTAEAIPALKAVRDHPRHPEYSMASRMARAYLEKLPISGPFGACLAAKWVVNSGYSSFQSTTEYSSAPDLQDAIGQWGFGNSALWDEGTSSICSEDTSFRRSMQLLNPHSTTQLADWFIAANLPIESIEKRDLNGDQIDDWLVVFNNYPAIDDYNLYYVWALLRNGEGITPVRINQGSTQYFSAGPLITRPTDQGLIHAIGIGDNLDVFRLINSQDTWGTETLFPYLDDGTKRILHYSLIPQSDPFSIHLEYKNSVFGIGGVIEQETFHWDTSSQWWAPSNQAPLPQKQALQQIQSLLFTQKNYPAAKQAIHELLARQILESIDCWPCNYPPIIRPYLLYLEGLCDELSGDGKAAIQSYWQVWNQYPASPFAYIVRLKLIHR
jgi:hypothetical protein